MPRPRLTLNHGPGNDTFRGRHTVAPAFALDMCSFMVTYARLCAWLTLAIGFGVFGVVVTIIEGTLLGNAELLWVAAACSAVAALDVGMATRQQGPVHASVPTTAQVPSLVHHPVSPTIITSGTNVPDPVVLDPVSIVHVMLATLQTTYVHRVVTVQNARMRVIGHRLEVQQALWAFLVTVLAQTHVGDSVRVKLTPGRHRGHSVVKVTAACVPGRPDITAAFIPHDQGTALTILHPEVLTPPTVRVMHPDADTSCTQGVRDNEVEPFEDVRLHFLGDVLLPPTGPGPQVDVSHGPGCACRTVHVPVLGHMAPTGHPNVLVVEDDVLGGNALARALHAVDVTVVRNISQAETIMQGTPNRWTHVFLDVILPDGDGVDLCTRMRTQMRFGGVMVAITALGNDGLGSNDHLAAAGFHAVLRKPFSLDHAITLVRSL